MPTTAEQDAFSKKIRDLKNMKEFDKKFDKELEELKENIKE